MSRGAAAHFNALQHAVQPRGALCRWTALHLASQSGTTELAAALLLMRADVNSKTSSGYPLRGRAAVPRATAAATAWEHAAQHRAACSVGVQRTAPRSMRDWRCSCTALHYAASSGHAETVKALIAARADVRCQEHGGCGRQRGGEHCDAFASLRRQRVHKA
jgi:hypothetical protein